MRPCPKRVGCKSIKKIPFLPNLSAQTREKTAHQLLALLPEHPPRHGRSGVEHRLGVTPEALLGIVGAPHHAAHLRPSDRPGAHDARLDRDVERALLQILAPERRGRACISAWAVGSARVSTRLCPRPITAPPATTTAPMGTSCCFNAFCASFSARRMNFSSVSCCSMPDCFRQK